jgi:hypothetical protein
MLRLGCFPFSDDDADVFFSDYQAAFGELGLTAERVQAKLNNPENRELEPFRRLRSGGMEEVKGGD